MRVWMYICNLQRLRTRLILSHSHIQTSMWNLYTSRYRVATMTVLYDLKQQTLEFVVLVIQTSLGLTSSKRETKRKGKWKQKRYRVRKMMRGGGKHTDWETERKNACVCACVCEREKERGRKRGKARKRKS